MDKDIKERLKDIEEKVSEMLSLFREVYVPDSRKEIHEVIAKHNGNIKTAVKELNMRNRIRYGNGELQH